MASFISQKIRKNKLDKNKVIISKKPISLEALYYYSVAKPRTRNTVQLVEKLRSHYTEKELMYDEDRQTMLLQKNLKVKWQPTTYINPIKEIRFFDYIFILESDMYKSESYGENNRHFNGTQLGFDKMYKCLMVEKKLKSNMIKLFIENKEEKNLEDIFDIKEIEYLKSWLMSMNSEQTKQIKDGIEILQENIKKGQLPYIKYGIEGQTELCSSQCNSNVANLSTNSEGTLQESNKKPEKYWIKRLNLQTKKWLKDFPFFKRNYEIVSSIPKMRTFEMNEHFVRITGYQSNFVKNEWNFLKNMIAFSYSDILVTRIFQNRYEGDLKYLINKIGIDNPRFITEIPTLFTGGNTDYFANYKVVFEEEYFLNSNRFKNTYIVFLYIP